MANVISRVKIARDGGIVKMFKHCKVFSVQMIGNEVFVFTITDDMGDKKNLVEENVKFGYYAFGVEILTDDFNLFGTVVNHQNGNCFYVVQFIEENTKEEKSVINKKRR